ncbi:MAG: hypothetical protein WCJ33_02355 [Pseudomonadota bacterium]
MLENLIMLGYVVTINEKPTAVLARKYRNFLVETGTIMPIIDEEKLANIPNNKELVGLIEKARIAQTAISDLLSEIRKKNKKARDNEEKLTPQQIKSSRTKRIREYRKEFTELKHRTSEKFPDGADRDIERLWEHPQIKDIAIKAPEPRNIIDKLIEHDFNFTPDEVATFWQYSKGFSILYHFGGKELAKAVGDAKMNASISSMSPVYEDINKLIDLIIEIPGLKIKIQPKNINTLVTSLNPNFNQNVYENADKQRFNFIVYVNKFI